MKLSPLSTAALGIALSLSAASASAINIGGIEIQPGFHAEVASVYENFVGAVGDELTGYGEITSINGVGAYGPGGFCTKAPFCELTYTFGGYVVNDITYSSPGIISEIVFSGGWVNFYVGSDASLDLNPHQLPGSQANDLIEATDGALWLTLAGHEHTVDGKTGSLFSTIDEFGVTILKGEGSGFLDVDLTGTANGNTAGPGALANSNLDTNALQDLQGLDTDFLLGSSYSTSLAAQHGDTPLGGSVDIRGTAIPEPGTLTMLGLGLLGLGALSRRRKTKA